MAYRAEYIWIDGKKPTALLRSKTKVLPDGEEIPIWGFDGSSTEQAPGDQSDCVLNPVKIVPDPIRGGDDVLVMCEVLNVDMTPHETNTRAGAVAALEKYGDQEPWFGLEQEYTFYKDGRPHGWPIGGFPAPQGGYYCGIGADEIWGRDIVEDHTWACIEAGLSISGTNAEVMIGQWEFQIGPADTVTVGDELWLARWLLYRIAEDYDISATLEPKPVQGDWNGAGMHTNFSTRAMREGWDPIIAACEALGEKAQEHVQQLRCRHRAKAHRDARDGTMVRVFIRYIGPWSIGPYPVDGRQGQEGLHRGSSSERECRSVRCRRVDH